MALDPNIILAAQTPDIAGGYMTGRKFASDLEQAAMQRELMQQQSTAQNQESQLQAGAFAYQGLQHIKSLPPEQRFPVAQMYEAKLQAMGIKGDTALSESDVIDDNALAQHEAALKPIYDHYMMSKGGGAGGRANPTVTGNQVMYETTNDKGERVKVLASTEYDPNNPGQLKTITAELPANAVILNRTGENPENVRTEDMANKIAIAQRQAEIKNAADLAAIFQQMTPKAQAEAQTTAAKQNEQAAFETLGAAKDIQQNNTIGKLEKMNELLNGVETGGLNTTLNKWANYFNVDTEEVADKNQFNALAKNQLVALLDSAKGVQTNLDQQVRELTMPNVDLTTSTNKRLVAQYVADLKRKMSFAKNIYMRDKEKYPVFKDVFEDGQPAQQEAPAPAAQAPAIAPEDKAKLNKIREARGLPPL